MDVVCPPPLLPMPGNLSCGCEAGLERTPTLSPTPSTTLTLAYTLSLALGRTLTVS